MVGTAQKRLCPPTDFARRANHSKSVQPFLEKYSAFPVGQIISTSSPHPVPKRGALAIVTNVGMGCGGRGSVGRVIAVAGRFYVSDRAARGRTALQRLRQDFGRLHAGGLGIGGGCCVRQSRVVLAPVAGVKLAEVVRTLPGFRSTANPSATVTRRIRRRGEHGISRKAIAQGRPECFR